MEFGDGPLGSMFVPAGSLASIGARFSCGLPHISLQRWPRSMSLCCSSSTARSAAGLAAYVTKAQCLFVITCTKPDCQQVCILCTRLSYLHDLAEPYVRVMRSICFGALLQGYGGRDYAMLLGRSVHAPDIILMPQKQPC